MPFPVVGGNEHLRDPSRRKSTVNSIRERGLSVLQKKRSVIEQRISKLKLPKNNLGEGRQSEVLG